MPADEEADKLGSESEEDEFDEGAEGELGGSDSEADMEALLANAVKLAGKRARAKRVRCEWHAVQAQGAGVRWGWWAQGAGQAQLQPAWRRQLQARQPSMR